MASDYPNRLADPGGWLGAIPVSADGAAVEASRTPLADLNYLYADHDREALGKLPPFLVTGRIVNRRSNFIVLQDDGGGDNRLQLYIQRKGEEALDEAAQREADAWGVGDIVAAYGALWRSDKGALYLRMRALQRFVKSQVALPSVHYGLRDAETRKRRRHLDLIANPEARQRLLHRFAITEQLRRFFASRDFLEVETPMLHSIASGAVATPFATHYNSLDMDVYLRIAPELDLKRLVVGGMGNVFELGRNFRNEGLSHKHNPEFTMLECYAPWRDWRWMMGLLRDCLRSLLPADGKLRYRGRDYDFGTGNWGEKTLVAAVLENNPKLRAVADEDALNGKLLQEREGILHFIHSHETEIIPGGKGFIRSVPSRYFPRRDWEPALEAALRESLRDCDGGDLDALNPKWRLGMVLSHLYEKSVEGGIEGPLFITAHPWEASPLARACDDNPALTERFELIVGGMELANGFSELNDPEEQRLHFLLSLMGHGDDENRQDEQPVDENYLDALRCGLPPTAGAGLGVDRLAMLLTDSASVREVLSFPLARGGADASAAPAETGDDPPQSD